MAKLGLLPPSKRQGKRIESSLSSQVLDLSVMSTEKGIYGKQNDDHHVLTAYHESSLLQSSRYEARLTSKT